jgi:anti-anti-sigma factor
MKIQVTTIAEGRMGLVKLEGEIDFSVVTEMRQAIDEGFSIGNDHVLIDLSSLQFIASDGLGVLIDAQRNAEANGRTLDLIKPQGHIYQLLETTQLTKLFHLHDNIEDAIKSLD